MNIETKLITPAIARELLEMNGYNRRIQEPKIERYRKDMSSGRWKEGTTETIKISRSNRILDGQHRLWAVIKSNVSINFFIASGLEDDIFDVLDTGTSRSANDVFKISGIKNDTTVPSIIQTWHMLHTNTLIRGHQINTRLSNAQLLTEYKQRSAFWDTVTRTAIARYQSFAKIISPSIIGGFYAVLVGVDTAMGESFINELCTGENITNKVISLLRNILIKDKVSLRKMPVNIKSALIIKAWNCYYKNEKLKILMFNPEKEKYPIIKTTN